MKCWEICKELEQDFPVDKACEWDNVGLLVGDSEQEIKKIFVALDATEAIIDEAITWGADLLLTHHPLIFSPLKQINTSDFISSRVVKLLNNRVNCYAMHTNYDVIKMGDLAEEKLGMSSSYVFLPLDSDSAVGLGRCGELKNPCTIRDLGERIKHVFSLKNVTVYGDDLEREIRKIAILPGSGKSGIETAIKEGVEVYITGDIGYHEGVDAVSRGLCIIDAGHYGIEHIFIEDMSNYLKKRWEGVAVKSASIIHPSCTI